MIDHTTLYFVRICASPSAGFEVKVTGNTCGPILDLHKPVVIDGWRASDDADNGRGDLLPGVEFFTARGRTEAKEPGSEGIYIERLTVEFAPDGGLTPVVPLFGLGVSGTDGRMVRDLLNEKAVVLVGPTVFVSFSEEGVEGFGNTPGRGGVLGSSKSSNIHHPFSRVRAVGSNIKKISVFHVFCYTLEERSRLVERDGECHLGHILANHGFQDTLHN
jgi:hypothetical protein